MEVYLNRIDGIDDALISMYLSKRTLTRALEMEIRNEVAENSFMHISPEGPIGRLTECSGHLKELLGRLCRWGHSISRCSGLSISHLLYMGCIARDKMILILMQCG